MTSPRAKELKRGAARRRAHLRALAAANASNNCVEATKEELVFLETRVANLGKMKTNRRGGMDQDDPDDFGPRLLSRKGCVPSDVAIEID
jgi:hypothetical protein